VDRERQPVDRLDHAVRRREVHLEVADLEQHLALEAPLAGGGTHYE
jgi:hypothetical protein